MTPDADVAVLAAYAARGRLDEEFQRPPLPDADGGASLAGGGWRMRGSLWNGGRFAGLVGATEADLDAADPGDALTVAVAPLTQREGTPHPWLAAAAAGRRAPPPQGAPGGLTVPRQS